MVTKLNPRVITDDMMYEGVDLSESFYPAAEIDAWSAEYELTGVIEDIKEDRLWGQIRRAAKENSALQEALDHAIMIYKLSKEYKDGI